MSKRSWVPALGLLTQLSVSMAVPIFGCTFVGIFLDNLTNKAPLFLVIFMLLGVGAAFRNMFYIILKQVDKREEEDNE